MGTHLHDTNSAAIAAELLLARRHAGSPAMGMVLTLVVDTDEAGADTALAAAREASTEHPARVIGVVRGRASGASNVDAEIMIGRGAQGETVLIRLSGAVAAHAESVVLPLLLPDSPVVIWWPGRAPDDPASDPLGALGRRRITDCAAVPACEPDPLLTQCAAFAPGNTDLSWTRLTVWRGLLAAALDGYPGTVSAAEVVAEPDSPSAELLRAWLTDRLNVRAARLESEGPGITSVRLVTAAGEISITRADGRLAVLTSPGQPDRPLALKRRETAELLAEELRRLDNDDVYEATIKRLSKLEGVGR
ncbi:MAG TPA: glucose-6-phosphate dehydrogenase assembly protein OpcA [Nocardioidaceae bacterium]|nr:glucose-6-phosphate dehydrogenase assembly protein OpcA [Nocardioidaceae bacterium]